MGGRCGGGEEAEGWDYCGAGEADGGDEEEKGGDEKGGEFGAGGEFVTLGKSKAMLTT